MLGSMVTAARDLPDDELVGELIQKRYRILRRIAEGGMGAVYARDEASSPGCTGVGICMPILWPVTTCSNFQSSSHPWSVRRLVDGDIV